MEILLLERSFEEIGVQKIEITLTEKKNSYTFNENPVDLTEFFPHKIRFPEKFFKYLKYMKSVTDFFYTVKNLLGYTKQNSQYYIITEQVPEGASLSNHLKTLSLTRKLSIVKQVAEIIRYFNVEKDLGVEVISTANIFLINDNIKLNLSCLKRVISECQICNNKVRQTLLYEYMPPDIFDMDEENMENLIFPKQGNIWSLGCVISELFSGTVPWYNKYKQNDLVIIKLLIKKIQFPIPEKLWKISEKVAKIVEGCTIVNREERIGIDEVIERVNCVLEGKMKIYTMIIAFNSQKQFRRRLTRKNILVELYRFL